MHSIVPVTFVMNKIKNVQKKIIFFDNFVYATAHYTVQYIWFG